MVDQVVGLDESKRIVYFTGTKDDARRRPIYRVGLNGGGFSRLTGPAGTHSAKLSPDGQYLLDTHSSISQPPVISLLDTSGRTVRVVDAPENRLSDFELGQTEEHVVTAPDGTSLMAALTKPAHFDPSKKYPVIVYVYGGPHAQVVKDAWNGSLMDQLLASRGFLVWSLDNRGSWGRGHAWESVLSLETGKHELADQLAGVSYLKTLPFVDPARIGIWGWSYGGYMTLYALDPGSRRLEMRRRGGSGDALEVLRLDLHRALHEDAARESAGVRGFRASLQGRRSQGQAPDHPGARG